MRTIPHGLVFDGFITLQKRYLGKKTFCHKCNKKIFRIKTSLKKTCPDCRRIRKQELGNFYARTHKKVSKYAGLEPSFVNSDLDKNTDII